MLAIIKGIISTLKEKMAEQNTNQLISETRTAFSDDQWSRIVTAVEKLKEQKKQEQQ